MDNQPSFDRELLLPILLGGFSILGILIILLIGRLSAARASVIVDETETPFKYIFLGTEPVLSSGTPEASGTELLTDIPFDSPTPGSTDVIATPALGTPVLLTPNGTAPPDFPPNNGGGPPGSGTLPANADTPTSGSGPPLSPGTYDDADSRLIYNGTWASQTSLHVSTAFGNSVTFRFIGTEFRIAYMGGPSLGQVRITIDNQDFTLDQSDSPPYEWASSDYISLQNITHTVVITHISGGSVNLDEVIVPSALTPTTTGTPPTATPTRTPTSTPTQ